MQRGGSGPSFSRAASGAWHSVWPPAPYASVSSLGSSRVEIFLQGKDMSCFGPGPAILLEGGLEEDRLNLAAGTFLDPDDSWASLCQVMTE